MATIFIVDDSPTACSKIANTLSPGFECFKYTSAATALEEMEKHKPAIVLLDINMPEIDGYEACKRIKQEHAELSPLIIFVSGVDSLEQRLLAYDVGGHDFITKPFSEEELLKKIDNISQLITEKAQLIESENQSKSLVMTTMKQASQYSYIMGFFKNLQHCQSYEELIILFFNAMEHFSLHTSLMIPGDPDRFFSSPTNFEITPIEKSIYETVHEMGRLYEFGQRMMVNDKHVSFLVKNMPESSEDAGEIRDVVAVIIEGMEAKVVDLMRQEGLREITTELSGSIESINAGVTHHNKIVSGVITDMIGEMASSFHRLELSEEQEAFFTELIERNGKKIMSVEQVLIDVQNQLSLVSKHVETIIAETTEPQENKPSLDANTEDCDDIELF